MNHKLAMRTLIAASLWVIVMLILTPVCISSSQTTVYVAPSTVTVTVGQTFSVSIEISDVTDLYAWEFKLKWNPAFLNALRVMEGDFLKSGGNIFFWQIINNSRGCLLAICTFYGNIPGVNGSGTLAIIEFEVKSAGESILDLYDTKLVNSLEQSINHTCEDGYATTSESVGGVWVPINKLELLAPWIALATVSVVATAVVFVKCRKRISSILTKPKNKWIC
ncbi:MAG: cohesin domain-containing protein [Candidatus Bathyarchaeia archaeon]